MRYDHFTMLPDRAFQKRFGFSSPATLEGGKSAPEPPPFPEANPGFSYDPSKFTPSAPTPANTDRLPGFPVYTPDYSQYEIIPEPGLPSLNQPITYGDLMNLSQDAGFLTTLGSLISGYGAPSQTEGESSGIAGLTGKE